MKCKITSIHPEDAYYNNKHLRNRMGILENPVQIKQGYYSGEFILKNPLKGKNGEVKNVYFFAVKVKPI